MYPAILEKKGFHIYKQGTYNRNFRVERIDNWCGLTEDKPKSIEFFGSQPFNFIVSTLMHKIEICSILT